ncbi:MAG: 23S rRNA (guanosine(2251)-2'-O)-methyltransferase RlmB [Bacilli bacterium]|nr:23S rRNA (guanosine(2251)-2'-O)-methyltransferase RlmB [Bacilli bacterium]
MASLIYGRNSVIAALTSSRVNKITIADSFNDQRILSLAKEKKIPLLKVSTAKLNELVHNSHHQGVVAEVKDYQYYDLTTLINDGKQVENPVIIMLDGIEDPHNLGAILRIADAFNAIGVVVKKTNQAPLNATVDKVSTGAINYVKVAEVSNLNVAIKKLKEAGYWIIATDGDGKDNYASLDYKMPIVLIIGSEGNGISNLVKNNSDFLVKIPMYGHVNSLNASNALSVILSHITNLKHSPR